MPVEVQHPQVHVLDHLVRRPHTLLEALGQGQLAPAWGAPQQVDARDAVLPLRLLGHVLPPQPPEVPRSVLVRVVLLHPDGRLTHRVLDIHPPPNGHRPSPPDVRGEGKILLLRTPRALPLAASSPDEELALNLVPAAGPRVDPPGQVSCARVQPRPPAEVGVGVGRTFRVRHVPRLCETLEKLGAEVAQPLVPERQREPLVPHKLSAVARALLAGERARHVERLAIEVNAVDGVLRHRV
mmetsp:Transcript_18961/g.39579  ORF Transcript_18961/g.39579 Transcript_18961/m.39579 type:complete len:240 (-) Transcript_18961:467-1186(-)